MTKYRSRHSAAGAAQISEFGLALFFLFVCVVIPLINLCVVPLRWGLGKQIVGEKVHQLSQLETLSQAFKAGDSDTAGDKLTKLGGIAVKSSQLSLTVESAKLQGQTKEILKAGTIPKDWLPDGTLGPYVYRLDLTVDADVSPLIVLPLPNLKIPGLTAPFPVVFHDTSVWENTGRDPASGEFYLNE